MCVHNGLYGIRYDLAGRKRVEHPVVPHCYTVIDTDSVKYERNTACFAYRFFYDLAILMKEKMPRNDVYITVRYADERFVKIFIL